VVDYIDPLPGEAIPDYAKRLHRNLRPVRKFYLVGVSFGGTLALELARLSQPEAVILVGSATKAEELSREVRLLADKAAMLPEVLWSRIRDHHELIEQYLGIQDPKVSQIMDDVFEQLNLKAVRWGLKKLPHWELDFEPNCPVYRLHGSEDRVAIPADWESVEKVEGGGHLINVTHPGQVNPYLQQVIQRKAAPWSRLSS